TEYYPTNTRLPMRFALLNDHTLIVVLNHTFATGRAGLYWFEDWLQFYETDGGETPSLIMQKTRRKPGLLKQIGRDVVGMYWLALYVIRFFLDAGKDAPGKTVDLSHGRQTDLYRS
ncbi:MAG: hypothetical protein CUN56_16920, partial [Phototrophicales bacterium]